MTTTYAGWVSETSRLTFDQLSPSSKEIARSTVLDCERKAIRRTVQVIRGLNIHRVINDGYHIRGIVRNLSMVTALQNDQLRLDRFITENLCHFLEDGTYLTYFRE